METETAMLTDQEVPAADLPAEVPAVEMSGE